MLTLVMASEAKPKEEDSERGGLGLDWSGCLSGNRFMCILGNPRDCVDLRRMTAERLGF